MGLPSKVGVGTAGTKPSLSQGHTQPQGKPGFLPASQDLDLESTWPFQLSYLATHPSWLESEAHPQTRALPLRRSPEDAASPMHRPQSRGRREGWGDAMEPGWLRLETRVCQTRSHATSAKMRSGPHLP